MNRVRIDNDCEGVIVNAPRGEEVGMICQIMLDDGNKMLGWIVKIINE